MNTSISLTDAARLPVAHFQELFHSLTKPEGRHQTRSISTPSLPLHHASWKHIVGILYSGTYGSCCTGLIWATPFSHIPQRCLLDCMDILCLSRLAGHLTLSHLPLHVIRRCLVDHADILCTPMQADVTFPPQCRIRA